MQDFRNIIIFLILSISFLSSQGENVYRQSVQEYDVSSYYGAGNLLRTCVTDSAGNKLIEDVSEYYRFGLTTAPSSRYNGGSYRFSASFDSRNDRGAAYTPQEYTRSVRYDGNPAGTVMSESYSTYYVSDGDHGLLHTYRYSDKGTLGSSGSGEYDYMTAIQYQSDLAGQRHIFGLPYKVRVSHGGTVYHETEATYDTGHASHLTQVKRLLSTGNAGTVIDGPVVGPVFRGTSPGSGTNGLSGGGIIRPVFETHPDQENSNFAVQYMNPKYAVSDYTYDRYGNMRRASLPANSLGQRMQYYCKYDSAEMNMYPVVVEDSRGFTSHSSGIDYRFGIVRNVEDIHGMHTRMYTDSLGRITGYNAPIELSSIEGNLGNIDSPPYQTISFEYEPKAVIDTISGHILRPAYSLTRHLNGIADGIPDYVETITFVDGFGRPIQVQREGEIENPDKNGTEHVFVASGWQQYDSFGRIVASYHPTATEYSDTVLFCAQKDNVTPTTVEYDMLDRPVIQTLPDGAQTRYTYEATGHCIRTTVTDAMGHDSETWTDGSGRTVKSVQYADTGNSDSITTTFAYDGVGRLTAVTDTEGNVTSSIYDMGDRRTEVSHPASGRTTYTYDALGNVLTKKTANMQGTDKAIRYHYYYSQLDSVFYPDHPENNVVYHYGNKNDLPELRGRVKLRIDGTGAIEYGYGKLGEVTSERRTVIIPNQVITTFLTRWQYDSHNRLLQLTYPDGASVRYSYDHGGTLYSVAGNFRNQRYTYAKNIRYDKHGDLVYMENGNNVQTRNTYDEERRRIEEVNVGGIYGGGSVVRAYDYDAVSNITRLTTATSGVSMMLNGTSEHRYGYDALSRLTSANGAYGGNASYQLSMAYDKMYRVTNKWQTLSQNGLQFTGTLNAGYALDYTYNTASGKRFQMSNVNDVNYRTDSTPSKADDIIDTHRYEYDKNGNITYVGTARKGPGSESYAKVAEKTHEEKFLWDEENRLLAISQNGYVSSYWYDADGERVVKEHGGNGDIFVNSLFNGGFTVTDSYSVYPSAFYSYSNDGRYTKHVYIGASRIASQVSEQPEQWQNDVAGHGTSQHIRVDYLSKRELQKARIDSAYRAFGFIYKGEDHDVGNDYPFDYPNYWGNAHNAPLISGDTCNNGQDAQQAPFNLQRDLVYYYHKDHLGSSAFITNDSACVTQQIEYLPYGEVFLEKQRNTGDYQTPYRFNGKELDEETGLYYYGARYMNPRLSIWYGTDAMEQKYPNISSYAYCTGNPVIVLDSDGNEPVYNKKGYYLGSTKEGFTGDILIYNDNNRINVKQFTREQLENKVPIFTLDDAREFNLIENKAKQNIWNNIVSHFEGLNVYDENFSMSDLREGKILFNDDNGSWSTYADYFNKYNGKPKIYGTDKYIYYESTVENIASSIIVHEWYSHGKKHNGDRYKSHRLAYQNVINYKKLWNKTTDKYKTFVLNQLKYYNYKENHKNSVPRLYRRLYKKYCK